MTEQKIFEDNNKFSTKASCQRFGLTKNSSREEHTNKNQSTNSLTKNKLMETNRPSAKEYY